MKTSLPRAFVAAIAGAALAAGCGTILVLDADPDALPSRDGGTGDGDVGDGGPGVDGCTNGTIACSGSCVDPRTNKAHCGRCDNKCNLGPCKDGGCERTVFVTSTLYNGNLGGLDGGDEKCASLASTAGLPGTYKAWLADDTGSPITRFSKDSAGYLLPDSGGSVASGWGDLVDGMLERPISVSEQGLFRPATSVWSNVKGDGGRAGLESCSNWTDGDAATPTVIGQSGEADLKWTESNISVASCATTFALYCFEQ